MNHVLLYLELTKQEFEIQAKTSKRLRNYFRAIDSNATDKHWDYRDVCRGKMTIGEFRKKWRRKHMNRAIIVTKDKEIFVSSSEADHVICPVCLATNMVLDLECRNCGKRLKK